MGLSTNLDLLTKRQILPPARNWSPIIQLIANHYTDGAIPAPQGLLSLFFMHHPPLLASLMSIIVSEFWL
jgi:hypothetical protein